VIYVALAVVAVVVIVVAIGAWSKHHLHKIAQEATEQAMMKVFKRAQDEVRALPDPQRPLTLREAADELRKTSDRGRDPE